MGESPQYHFREEGMFEIPGYNLYSFVVGTQHLRAFSIQSTGGTLIDYVLGEAGAQNSPLPRDYYGKVTRSPDGLSLELTSENASNRLRVSTDRIVLSETSVAPDRPLQDVEGTMRIAQHLFPGLLSYLNNPKVVFLGMVWKYVKNQIHDCSRFGHPPAEYLSTNLLKVTPDQKEYPGDFSLRYAFRKRLPDSLVRKDLNDYMNIILEFKEEERRRLWDNEDKFVEEGETEAPRVVTVQIDGQRKFDPNVSTFTPQLFDNHFKWCREFMFCRFREILRGLELLDDQKDQI